MRERLVTLAAALGALALFLGIFLPSGGGTRAGDAPRPTTDERRADGYSAARSWLEAEGIRVISLRARLGTLAERRDLAPRGNLLIVTLPGVTGFSSAELARLERWVRAGNALLVAAALEDVPDWAVARAGLVPGDVSLLTGLSLEPLHTGARRVLEKRARSASRGAASRGAPAWSVLVPNGEHPYLRNVRQAIAVSDPNAARASAPWALKIPDAGFALELAHEPASGAGVLWMRPLGAGRLIVSGFGSLFTNGALGLAGNGQLLANLVATNVGPDGSVIFDDLHQGLGTVYDASRFYHDPRLYETVGVLLVLWLAWVLGSTRLRAPQERASAPREAELLSASGALLARVVRPEEAARRLFDHLLSSVPAAPGGVAGASHAADRWRALERHPRIPAADLAQLERWHADARAGRRVPLRALHTLIARTERLFRP